MQTHQGYRIHQDLVQVLRGSDGSRLYQVMKPDALREQVSSRKAVVLFGSNVSQRKLKDVLSEARCKAVSKPLMSRSHRNSQSNVFSYRVFGGFVYRLGHRPFTSVRGVRFPYPLPSYALDSFCCELDLKPDVDRFNSCQGRQVYGDVGKLVTPVDCKSAALRHCVFDSHRLHQV